MPKNQMQSGASAKVTGGLSEKRVVSYTARYFGTRIDGVLFYPLTPDASTRKYYRVATADAPGRSYIISLYPSPFNPQDNSYLDITRLFEGAGLPVPKVIDVAGTEGIILQEDLGDDSLTKWIEDATGRDDNIGVEKMMGRAIELIAQIQTSTRLAYDFNSVSSRLAFDEDKLSWELNYFYDHFFGSFRGHHFDPSVERSIKRELEAIASELAARPRVLTHRDYHGMNLMVDGNGELRVIDHQDARMGPATYDLVPLLVERRLRPVDEFWVGEQQAVFLRNRAGLGLPPIPPNELEYEFNLMTVQRQLKAIGTFSYQTAVVGRGVAYEKYIAPSIETVLRAMSKPCMKEYPALRSALEKLS